MNEQQFENLKQFIDFKLDEVETRFSSKLGATEHRLGSRIGKLENGMGKIDIKLGKLENKMGKIEIKFEQLRQEMLDGFAGVGEAIELINSRIDDKLSNLDQIA